jgi:hypothetical protein
MSKLAKLKTFYTLDEAVVEVSKFLDEPISLVDIYQASLDGYLQLSVRLLEDCYVVVGKTSIDGAGDDLREVSGLDATSEHMSFSNQVFRIDGIWDLVIDSIGKVEIENLYLAEIGYNDSVELTKGVILLKDGSTICKLQEKILPSKEDIKLFFDIQNTLEINAKKILKFHKITAEEFIDFVTQSKGALPSDITDKDIVTLYEWCFGNGDTLPALKYMDSTTLGNHKHHIVVNRDELQRFIHLLNGDSEDICKDEKPMRSKERNSLLSMIGAFMTYSKIDYSQRGVTNAVREVMELAGVSLGEDTILKIMKKIGPAMESRNKEKN